MIKAEFSASLLQSSVSHDPSEIILICWFAAQETFLIIINVENGCAASYFCGNRDAQPFKSLELVSKKRDIKTFNQQRLFKSDIKDIWSFYSSKNPEKHMKQHNLIIWIHFFLSSKSAY